MLHLQYIPLCGNVVSSQPILHEGSARYKQTIKTACEEVPLLTMVTSHNRKVVNMICVIVTSFELLILYLLLERIDYWAVVETTLTFTSSTELSGWLAEIPKIGKEI